MAIRYKDDMIRRRSQSFFEAIHSNVLSFNSNNNSNTESISQTALRKNNGNKFDFDVRSSIKNYYNKYNLTFDPEKYILKRNNSAKRRTRRSIILDLDSIPDKKTESSKINVKKDIQLKYSFQDIAGIFSNLKNLPDPREFMKFIHPVMYLKPKTAIDHQREKREKRDRAYTIYESKFTN